MARKRGRMLLWKMVFGCVLLLVQLVTAGSSQEVTTGSSQECVSNGTECKEGCFKQYKMKTNTTTTTSTTTTTATTTTTTTITTTTTTTPTTTRTTTTIPAPLLTMPPKTATQTTATTLSPPLPPGKRKRSVDDRDVDNVHNQDRTADEMRERRESESTKNTAPSNWDLMEEQFNMAERDEREWFRKEQEEEDYDDELLDEELKQQMKETNDVAKQALRESAKLKKEIAGERKTLQFEEREQKKAKLYYNTNTNSQAIEHSAQIKPSRSATRNTGSDSTKHHRQVRSLPPKAQRISDMMDKMDLDNWSCVPQCSEGFFASTTNRTCVTQCSEGFFASTTNRTCLLCSMLVRNCTECEDHGQCRRCAPGMFLLYETTDPEPGPDSTTSSNVDSTNDTDDSKDNPYSWECVLNCPETHMVENNSRCVAKNKVTDTYVCNMKPPSMGIGICIVLPVVTVVVVVLVIVVVVLLVIRWKKKEAKKKAKPRSLPPSIDQLDNIRGHGVEWLDYSNQHQPTAASPADVHPTAEEDVGGVGALHPGPGLGPSPGLSEPPPEHLTSSTSSATSPYALVRFPWSQKIKTIATRRKDKKKAKKTAKNESPDYYNLNNLQNTTPHPTPIVNNNRQPQEQLHPSNNPNLIAPNVEAATATGRVDHRGGAPGIVEPGGKTPRKVEPEGVEPEGVEPGTKEPYYANTNSPDYENKDVIEEASLAKLMEHQAGLNLGANSKSNQPRFSSDKRDARPPKHQYHKTADQQQPKQSHHHPSGPPIHPTGPPIHPTGPSIHPTGPPIHPTGPPIHPTGPSITPDEMDMEIPPPQPCNNPALKHHNYYNQQAALLAAKQAVSSRSAPHLPFMTSPPRR